MALKNSTQQFGWLSISLHWLVAILTLGLFGLGYWMVGLDYYSTWYQTAPWWHKGLGSIVFALVLIRWFWQCVTSSPAAIKSIPKWQSASAHLVHGAMNILIVLLAITGYLIVTAKGQELNLFDVVKVPALITDIAQLEDITGMLHRWCAWTIIALASLHALAAIKHHFIDKDMTLKRMLGINQEEA
jgi:cytochrome b561